MGRFHPQVVAVFTFHSHTVTLLSFHSQSMALWFHHTSSDKFKIRRDHTNCKVNFKSNCFSFLHWLYIEADSSDILCIKCSLWFRFSLKWSWYKIFNKYFAITLYWNDLGTKYSINIFPLRYIEHSYILSRHFHSLNATSFQNSLF